MFELAGVPVLVFCVCLCVYGCSVCLRMCLHMYFVFGCVSAYVCILTKMCVSYFDNMHVLINYLFMIYNHLLINITHLGPNRLV